LGGNDLKVDRVAGFIDGSSRYGTTSSSGMVIFTRCSIFASTVPQEINAVLFSGTLRQKLLGSEFTCLDRILLLGRFIAADIQQDRR